MLPNSDDELDGDDMEHYYQYRGCVIEDKARGRFVVQIRDKKTRKAVYNKATFKDRFSAEQHLRQKLFEKNAEAYAKQCGISTAPSQQAPTVLPQEAASISNYPKIKLREYALSFLNQISDKTSTMTMEGYRTNLSWLSNRILNKYMYDITTKDIENEYTRLSLEYKQSSLNRLHVILGKLFRIAAGGDRGNKVLPIIPTNPMLGLGKPKSNVRTNESVNPFPTFSDDDISLLFATSKEYNFELYVAFTVLECTGMRPGELRALRWKSFHPEEKYIDIYQAGTSQYEEFESLTKSPKKKTVLGPTKNGKSRQVQLSSTAVEALKEWRVLLDKRKNKKKKESPFIFPNRDGFIKSASGLESIVERYEEKYGLNDIGVNLYKFRHTVCTRLLRANYSFAIVMEVLGDDDVTVIKKHYEHLQKQDNRILIKDFYEQRYDKHGIVKSV